MPKDAQAPAEDGLARIRSISRLVRIMGALGLLIAIGGTLWVWTQPDIVLRTIAPSVGVHPAAVSTRMLALGFAVSLIPLALFVVAMVGLMRLFGAFQAGVVFEARNAARLATIGWVLVAYGLTSPVTRALLSVVLTLDNPSGQRALAVTIDSSLFLTVLGGAALLAFAAVLREAIRLADENRSFV